MAICMIGLPGVITAQQVNPNPDLTRQQVATFDQFLDSHPDIAKQLQANPSLVNNDEFMENHPALQTFLSNHPELREELKENPAFFMQRENRFEMAENRISNPPASTPNPDLSNQQLVTFDRFLDHHKGIAKDLEQNPSLINDQKFIKRHKELRSFLKNHPEVREELKENPSLFMREEARLEQRDAMTDRDRDRDKDKDKDKHHKHHKDKDKAKSKSKLEQKESLEPRRFH